jgi:ribosome-binding protein aMBF1 (putative translation factor)
MDKSTTYEAPFLLAANVHSSVRRKITLAMTKTHQVITPKGGAMSMFTQPDTHDADNRTASEERLIFARNFRKARKAANLTQRAVNDKTGFAQSWISEVETGQSSINIDNMAILAKLVNVPLWQLLVP